MIAPAHQEGFEFRPEADRLMMVAQLVQGLDLRQLIQTSQRVDTLGPILDPTRWQGSKHEHRKIAELAGLLRPFQERAAEIIAEAKAQLQAKEGA